MKNGYCRSVKSLKEESGKSRKRTFVIMVICIAMHTIIFTDLIPVKFHRLPEVKEYVNVSLVTPQKILKPIVRIPKLQEKTVVLNKTKPKSHIRRSKKKKEEPKSVRRERRKAKLIQATDIKPSDRTRKTQPPEAVITAKPFQTKTNIPKTKIKEAITPKVATARPGEPMVKPAAPAAIGYSSIHPKAQLGGPRANISAPITKHRLSVSSSEQHQLGMGGPLVLESPDAWLAEDLVMPKLLNGHQVKPLNPNTIRETIEITIKLQVDVNGKPRYVKVILPKPPYDNMLDDYIKSAVKSANQLRFSPGLQNGKRVPVLVRISITFDFKKSTVGTELFHDLLEEIAYPDVRKACF